MSTTEPYRPSTTSTSGRRLPTGERLPASRTQAKRWWAIRSSSILVFAAVGLCLFVIWNRDRNTVTLYMKMMEPVVKELQDKTTSLGVIPAHIPEPPPIGRARVAFSYTFAAEERYFAIRSDEPCIIAHTAPVPRFLLQKGRGVIIYHKGSVSAAWLTESEFSRRWEQQRRRLEEFQAQMRSRPVELP